MGLEPTIFGSGNRRLVHLATGTLSSQSIVGFQVFTRRRHERGRLLRTVAAIAGIAQLGERQTEDLKVAGSIPAAGNLFFLFPGPGEVFFRELACLKPRLS